MLRVPSVLLLASLVVGCDAPVPSASADTSAAPSSSVAKVPPPGSTAKPNSYGQPITQTSETTLAAIAAEPAKFANQEVRTAGTVKAVCKKAGCWMEIGDETSQAHIKMGGHSFTVPRDSSGRKAIVQGMVKEGAPQNECGSVDQCGGMENGATAKVEIVATGVQFVD